MRLDGLHITKSLDNCTALFQCILKQRRYRTIGPHLFFYDLQAPNDEEELTRFQRSLNGVFKVYGPGFRTLHFQDDLHSHLFSEAHWIFETLGTHVKNLRQIAIGNVTESMYIGDSNLLLLCMGCPLIERFVDELAFGLSLTVGSRSIDLVGTLSSGGWISFPAFFRSQQ